MCEYSIEQKQYTDWSRMVQRKGLHRLWVERDTPCLNVMFHPQNPSHVILHDTYMLCILDQSLVRQTLVKSLIFLMLVTIFLMHLFYVCSFSSHFLMIKLCSTISWLWRASQRRRGHITAMLLKSARPSRCVWATYPFLFWIKSLLYYPFLFLGYPVCWTDVGSVSGGGWASSRGRRHSVTCTHQTKEIRHIRINLSIYLYVCGLSEEVFLLRYW